MTITQDIAAGAAPTPEQMHHMALRVAVLGVLAEDAKADYELARKLAAVPFARARKLGIPQQAVLLPGNVEAGVLALKAGRTTVDVDEDALLLIVASATPTDTEDCVAPAAESDPRTVAVLAEYAPELVELRVKPGALGSELAVKTLAEHAPELVELRVRAPVRAQLQAYLEAHEGSVPDPATGEAVKVATITHHDPLGDFSWTGKNKYLGRVREAMESGRLIITANRDVAETVQGTVVGPAEVEAGDAA